MRIATFVLVACALGATVTMGTVLAAKDEIKPFIHQPKNWEGAVAEGKKLNLPIVVHSHGWN